MELNKWYAGNPAEEGIKLSQIECTECKRAGHLLFVGDDFSDDGKIQMVWVECEKCGSMVNLTFQIERRYKLLKAEG